ncbi:MAG: aminoacyl-tRNA hydrolase [Clostridia bacterium]|nr:aminoacyl-tRNA hydrolase [Clostridia bacterium]
MEKETFLIVGLGNPGEEYAHTRHNAGFEAADRVAGRLGLAFRKKPALEGALAEAAEPERKIVICEPETFMNNSGRCLRKLMDWYKIPPERVLILYDDIDLPPAHLRFRKNGGPGTHNGMRSIAEETGTTAFPRIRIGTGDRPRGQDLVSWVLGRPGPEERDAMAEAFDRAAEGALIWAREGAEKAMQAVNAGFKKPTGNVEEEKA